MSSAEGGDRWRSPKKRAYKDTGSRRRSMNPTKKENGDSEASRLGVLPAREFFIPLARNRDFSNIETATEKLTLASHSGRTTFMAWTCSG